MPSPRLPTPTDPGVRAILDRQVQVMFECAADSLAGVTLDECLWVGDVRSWNVHRRGERWCGELGDEPPDLPSPSLAWTMWHPIWWLETLLAHSKNLDVPGVVDVDWPGPTETLPRLRALWTDWMVFLDSLDASELRSGSLTKFPYTDGRGFVHVAGWASMEMVKNLSEMCVLRRCARDHLT